MNIESQITKRLEELDAEARRLKDLIYDCNAEAALIDQKKRSYQEDLIDVVTDFIPFAVFAYDHIPNSKRCRINLVSSLYKATNMSLKDAKAIIDNYTTFDPEA